MLALSKNASSTVVVLLLVIGPSYLLVCLFMEVRLASSTVLSCEVISLGPFFPDFVVFHDSSFSMQEERANFCEEF